MRGDGVKGGKKRLSRDCDEQSVGPALAINKLLVACAETWVSAEEMQTSHIRSR